MGETEITREESLARQALSWPISIEEGIAILQREIDQAILADPQIPESAKLEIRNRLPETE